jgi:hypothetical protein
MDNSVVTIVEKNPVVQIYRDSTGQWNMMNGESISQREYSGDCLSNAIKRARRWIRNNKGNNAPRHIAQSLEVLRKVEETCTK